MTAVSDTNNLSTVACSCYSIMKKKEGQQVVDLQNERKTLTILWSCMVKSLRGAP